MRRKTMKKFLFDEESGQGMVEYGLIIALIAVACIAAFGLLGGKINGKIGEVNNKLGGTTTGGGTTPTNP